MPFSSFNPRSIARIALVSGAALFATAGGTLGTSAAEDLPLASSSVAFAAHPVEQATIPTICSPPPPAETEGPYFTAGSPDSSNLAATGLVGTRLTLTGYVVDTSCR